MLNGDVPFWNPSLVMKGRSLSRLKQIETEFGVLLLRDKVKRQLKYFGSKAKQQAVRRSVVENLSVDPHEEYVIDLSDHDFAWACRGGFSQINETLGHGIASFDVVSKPKRIIIAGSLAQYRLAVDVLQYKKDSSKSGPTDLGDQDCSICWTPAESPVHLECRHVYCLECFDGLCKSADAGGTDFLILCQGNMGSCGKTLNLPEIKEHLSSTSLEEVLAISFASYTRRRPQEFRYCPTPECGNIYRADTHSKIYTCTRCLEVTCTSCHEQHGTMSCADFKDLKSGGYEAFEKYKKEMNIKDCPKCKTPIEKTYGCNHMTCGACKAHICWVCLMTFKEAGFCYDHLSAEHGGIFALEDLPRQ